LNRDENLAMWRRIADGELSGSEQWDSTDPWEWIRDVAQRVVAADAIKGKNERPAALIKAVGLTGQVDGYSELRRYVELLTDFDDLTVDGPQTQGQRIARMVESMRKSGLLTGVYEVDDKKAKDLIRAILHQRI